MTSANMHYANILAEFKIEYEAYQDLKSEDAPKALSINDQEQNCKEIKWAPIFSDCLSRTYGSCGPLIYVLRDEVAVPNEVLNPLQVNDTTGVVNGYFGKSGCLHDELVVRLPHSGPIYKHNNATVFMMIEKVTRNTIVDSTAKSFLSLSAQCCSF